MTTPLPIVRAPGEGDQRSFLGGGLHTWKLLAEDTAGAFFLMEDEMTQGKVTPLHRHPEADETVYVLEGEIVVTRTARRPGARGRRQLHPEGRAARVPRRLGDAAGC